MTYPIEAQTALFAKDWQDLQGEQKQQAALFAEDWQGLGGEKRHQTAILAKDWQGLEGEQRQQTALFAEDWQDLQGEQKQQAKFFIGVKASLMLFHSLQNPDTLDKPIQPFLSSLVRCLIIVKEFTMFCRNFSKDSFSKTFCEK